MGAVTYPIDQSVAQWLTSSTAKAKPSPITGCIVELVLMWGSGRWLTDRSDSGGGRDMGLHSGGRRIGGKCSRTGRGRGLSHPIRRGNNGGSTVHSAARRTDENEAQYKWQNKRQKPCLFHTPSPFSVSLYHTVCPLTSVFFYRICYFFYRICKQKTPPWQKPKRCFSSR